VKRLPDQLGFRGGILPFHEVELLLSRKSRDDLGLAYLSFTAQHAPGSSGGHQTRCNRFAASVHHSNSTRKPTFWESRHCRVFPRQGQCRTLIILVFEGTLLWLKGEKVRKRGTGDGKSEKSSSLALFACAKERTAIAPCGDNMGANLI